MTAALVIAAIWLVVAALVGPWVGRSLHRAAHRNGVADPADCPPWCVRERAAALLRRQYGVAVMAAAAHAATPFVLLPLLFLPFPAAVLLAAACAVATIAGLVAHEIRADTQPRRVRTRLRQQ